jgi:hypothetical protein
LAIENKLLNEIDESDLIQLIESKIREDKYWDYKREQIGKSDGDKKEFLQDICSFANASGGHIILGIEEGKGQERGLPKNLVGLNVNADEEIARLQSIILSGIEPRIPGLELMPVELESKPINPKPIAIVIRIPISISLPHMVKYQGHHTFYSRSANGKYPLEVSELRNLFAQSITAMEQIRNFRQERIKKILAGETPAPIKSSAKVIVHIVPFSRQDFIKKGIDIKTLVSEGNWFEPMTMTSHNQRFNLDGHVTDFQVAINDEIGISAYTQLFRDGSIEAVWNDPFVRHHNEKKIGHLFLEDVVIDYVEYCLRKMNSIGIEPPICIMLSLMGVSEYRLTTHSGFLTNKFERDNIMIPELMTETLDIDVPTELKPLWDIMWNSVGFSESQGYNKEGNRIQKSISHVHWRDYGFLPRS